MRLLDKNQSWKPPEGYALTGVNAQGAFLVIAYCRERRSAVVSHPTTLVETVNVYLNDQGREVARTETWQSISNEPLATAPPKPLTWGERIELWFRTTILGE